MKKFLPVLFAFVSLVPCRIFATGWTASMQAQKVFIENKGQFDNLNSSAQGNILFATESYADRVLFTKTGLTYRLEERTGPSKAERQAREAAMRKEIKEGKQISHREMEEAEHRMFIRKDVVNMQWVNPNPNVQIAAVDAVENYFNYGMEDKSIDRVKGFQKLLYQNLYSGIDVEYIFHPKGGIEYSFILHPGADASQIRMKYSDVSKVDENGNLLLPTALGNIIEHAPQTFYANNKSSTIASQFVLNGNEVTFSLGAYDNSQTVVIDPWVVTPSIPNSNGVWECEKDGIGNIYVIGGDMPMKLLKYNATGALQWTYNTPWDTLNYWLGTMATDLAGNTYITSGSSANIQKINPNGGLTWSAPGGALDEYWSIAFNCDQTKLIVGGTRLGIVPPADSYGMIFEINTNNGSVTNTQRVAANRSYTITIPFFGTQTVTDINEVRSITASRNARYYYLTLDSIGAFDQNFSACPNGSFAFKINDGYNLGYKCENFRPNNGNAGIKAIKANANFVYTQNGLVIQKRDLNTGAVLTSANIPGGLNTAIAGTTPTINQPGNSGIDIDNNGNVYVGSGTGVVKYDANLVQLSVSPTAYPVFDVAVSTNGDVVVCGASGDSNSPTRIGFIQSFAIGAAAPITLECCDANVCPAGPVCSSDAPFAFTPAATGGTWSGTGITNSTTGLFDPSIAGPGTHTITNTLLCGSGSVSITVNACATLVVCSNQNGSMTVSGGTGPYTWQSSVTALDCSACPFGMCIPGFCNGTNVTTWTTFATGSTATPPGTWPIRVRDNASNEIAIPSFASLTACSACALTASTSTTNATCGNSNGSATVNASGGTPTTYSWSSGATTATATNLAAGTYTVTISGAGCTATASATVIASNAVSLISSATNAGCGVNNGSATVNASGGNGSFTYAWSNGGTTATISNLAAGTYTVTVASNSCTATSSVTVNNTNGVTLTPSSTNAGCAPTGSATVAPAGGNGTFAYSWSNGGTGATISNLAAGTYTVTVTSAGCTATSSINVGSTGTVTTTTSVTNAGCSPTGSATVTPSGGTGSYTYTWSNGGTTSTISNLSAGVYTVTVMSASCSATANVTVSSTGSVSTTTSSSNAGCSPTGSATVIPSGGNGTFTYAWSNGETTSTISNVAAGTYNVTVTSANCTVTASVVVGSTGSVTATTSSTNAGCTSTGSATVSPVGGTGSFNYLWSNGGTGATISNVSGGNYTVTITSGNCTATASAFVTSAGGVTLLVSSTHTTCGNNNGSATVTATTGAGPFNYVWSNGVTGPAIINVAGGTYTATVTDANSCSATMSAQVDSSVVTPAVLVSDKLMMCSSDSAYICVQGTYVSYQWNMGATTQCIYTKLAGNYYVTVTDNAGCSPTSNRISINVYPSPPVSISVNGDTLTAYNAVTYQWFYNAVPINGATSNVYIATQAGDYTVAVTDSNNCGAISSKVNIVKTGVETLQREKGIKVYPNPLEFGMWNLEVGNSVIGSQVEIFDAEGRLVYKYQIQSPRSEINLNVASGVYVMRINSSAISVTHKLIKL